MLCRIISPLRNITSYSRLTTTPQYGVLNHEKFKEKVKGFSKPRKMLYELKEILVNVSTLIVHM